MPARHKDGGAVAFAVKNAIWSLRPVWTSVSRAGSSTSGWPYSRTAHITVPQPTPTVVATAATSNPS